jgi:hypothetical protein
MAPELDPSPTRAVRLLEERLNPVTALLAASAR